MSVSSRPGEGATFALELPAQAAELAQLGQPTQVGTLAAAQGPPRRE